MAAAQLNPSNSNISNNNNNNNLAVFPVCTAPLAATTTNNTTNPNNFPLFQSNTSAGLPLLQPHHVLAPAAAPAPTPAAANEVARLHGLLQGFMTETDRRINTIQGSLQVIAARLGNNPRSASPRRSASSSPPLHHRRHHHHHHSQAAAAQNPHLRRGGNFAAHSSLAAFGAGALPSELHGVSSPSSGPFPQIPGPFVEDIDLVSSSGGEGSPPLTARRSPPAHLNLSLSLSDVKTTWFTKRAFPWFEVSILDQAGNVFSDTKGWEVELQVLDGTGQPCPGAIRLSKRPSPVFAVEEGRAMVSGFRFSAVSSRHGGAFYLHLSLRKPERAGLPSLKSDPIRVLSERLYSEYKASSVLEMSPNDTVIHIPGIGKKYTSRLGEFGVRTVRDLADIDPERDAQRLEAILESLKQERGTMTSSRLRDIIADSKVVITRKGGAVAAAASAPTKRPRSESDAPTMLPLPSPPALPSSPSHGLCSVEETDPATCDAGTKGTEVKVEADDDGDETDDDLFSSAKRSRCSDGLFDSFASSLCGGHVDKPGCWDLPLGTGIPLITADTYIQL